MFLRPRCIKRTDQKLTGGDTSFGNGLTGAHNTCAKIQGISIGNGVNFRLSTNGVVHLESARSC